MTAVPLAAELRGVCFAHVQGAPVLVDVDLAIRRGERLAVVGPNGGGKTTLLRLLLGLLEPDSGRIEVLGRAPAEARRRIGYVPQHAAIDVSAPASALDVVLMGCLRRSPWGLRFGRRDRERAHEALDRVGLSAMVGRRLRELSGGQCQRVLIARALIGEPELLLLDEPTSGVDVDTERAIMASLLDLGDATLVLVSHDPQLVAEHFERVIHVHRQIRPGSMRTRRPASRGLRWEPSIARPEAPP